MQLEMGMAEAPTVPVLDGAMAEARAKLLLIVTGLASFMAVPKSPGGTLMTTDKTELEWARGRNRAQRCDDGEASAHIPPATSERAACRHWWRLRLRHARWQLLPCDLRRQR